MVGEDPSETLQGGPPEATRLTMHRRVTGLAIVLLTLALAAAVGAAVFYRHRAQSNPAVAQRSVSPAAVAPARPVLRSERHTVLGGRLKIDLLYVRNDDGSGPAQLSISAALTGGRPGISYRLVGGDCTTGTDRRAPWAVGRADPTGEAILRSRVWTVHADHSYYMMLEPWPFKFPHTPVTGLTGNVLAGGFAPLRVAHEPCL
jgi:hypothetical protein